MYDIPHTSDNMATLGALYKHRVIQLATTKASVKYSKFSNKICTIKKTNVHFKDMYNLKNAKICKLTI